jgi:hypothetical protein
LDISAENKEISTMTRKQLQATIKQLKLEGKVDKKFDARQSNLILSAEIERVTGVTTGIEAKKPVTKAPKISKKENNRVVSFKDAQNHAEKKGFVLQFSSNGMRLELYTDSSGRPKKFWLPSEVVSYINQLVA